MYLNKEYFSDFLSRKEISWLGIDFSLGTYTKKGFNLPHNILQQYFSEWNKLIISDQKKYNIRISFRKPIMDFDLSLITKRNAGIKGKTSICDHINIENTFDENYIKQYISQWDLRTQNDYALVFIVESLDQNLRNAAVWIAIIRTKTNELTLCEKFMERPAGLNTITYWARVFYNILLQIKDSSFPRWENYIKENY